jgi:protoheme IX farnesyltransferase
MALNQYLERDLDGRMIRTFSRPLPSGTIGNPAFVAILATAVTLSGIALSLAISVSVALIVALGAGIYVCVYTLWLKRRHPLNIVIGGAAGCCPVLAGWLAGAPGLTPTAWLLAALVFVWTPPHFWSLVLAYREDYRRAGIPMLPCLVGERAAAGHILFGTALTIGTAFLLSIVTGSKGVWLLAIGFGGAIFLGTGVQLLFRPEKTAAWRHYKVTSLFLAITFGALLLEATL